VQSGAEANPVGDIPGDKLNPCVPEAIPGARGPSDRHPPPAPNTGLDEERLAPPRTWPKRSGNDNWLTGKKRRRSYSYRAHYRPGGDGPWDCDHPYQSNQAEESERAPTAPVCVGHAFVVRY